MSVARLGTSDSRAAARRLEFLDKIEYRLAETNAERDAIYRLRYRAYLKEGAIEPNSSGTVTDRYDNLANSWVLGIFFEDVLTSSLRITVASPKHTDCPSMDVFPDFVRPWLATEKVIVDPTRFVADPLRANHLPELAYLTLRLAYVACEHFHADIGLATVRAEHQAFYRRFFMDTLSPPRPYPGLKKPIGLMTFDYPGSHAKVFARYPFLRSTPFERRMLFNRRIDREGPTLLRTDASGGAPLAAG